MTEQTKQKLLDENAKLRKLIETLENIVTSLGAMYIKSEQKKSLWKVVAGMKEVKS